MHYFVLCKQQAKGLGSFIFRKKLIILKEKVREGSTLYKANNNSKHNNNKVNSKQRHTHCSIRKKKQ